MDYGVIILAVAAVALTAVLVFALFKIRRLQKLLNQETLEKQQIISIVSHDIKAPFNRISALAQLFALEKQNLNDNQREYINKMLQTVADGLALIRNLVDYRNLEYRGLEIIPEKINLSELVHIKVKGFHSLAESKCVTLNTDIAPNMSAVSDNQCVSRVLDNLLGNAIKFSPSGKNIYVSVRPSRGQVILQVRDESGGFTEEDIGKLYQKFQRLSTKPTSGESTTGLGLFIVKTMLTKIGGRIQCVTKLGEGSTFTVTIPSELRMAL